MKVNGLALALVDFYSFLFLFSIMLITLTIVQQNSMETKQSRFLVRSRIICVFCVTFLQFRWFSRWLILIIKIGVNDYGFHRMMISCEMTRRMTINIIPNRNNLKNGKGKNVSQSAIQNIPTFHTVLVFYNMQ